MDAHSSNRAGGAANAFSLATGITQNKPYDAIVSHRLQLFKKCFVDYKTPPNFSAGMEVTGDSFLAELCWFWQLHWILFIKNWEEFHVSQQREKKSSCNCFKFFLDRIEL